MGAGKWSDVSYNKLSTARLASKGVKAFTYDKDVKTGVAAPIVHTALDPSKARLDGNGVKVRESRDSDEHPNSNAVAVLFDVTGSMGGIPRVLQTKLPKLMSSLLTKGYLSDPQIMFGGVGDAYCDQAPLQIGQFESDVRMDEDLDKVWLEGGGGGGNHESYDLAMYFMARHTSIDCLEKRNKRGYLFLICDEAYYKKVDKNQAQHVIGASLQEDIPIKDIAEELKEKYEVFVILATQSSYRDSNKGVWQELFGQNVLLLDNAELVCELIVTTIGIAEGILDPSGKLPDDLGLSANDAASVSRAVSLYNGGRAVAKAKTSGKLVSAGSKSGLKKV